MTEKVINLFEKIKQEKGISEIWLPVLKTLESLDKSLSENQQELLVIYFSLIDDGNTCICLDKEILFNKWKSKWDGLLLVSGDFSDEEKDAQLKEFALIIEKGIEEFLSKGSVLVEVSPKDFNKPFVIEEIDGKKWLFSTKYYLAKTSIEERIHKLFPNVPSDSAKDDAEAKAVTKEFADKTGFVLEEFQPYAVALGQHKNLIVTGGPGTGKTTAICFLLWKLFSQVDKDGVPLYKYNLYMAAPSGKAAERIKESISGSLKMFTSENDLEREIYRKLTETDSSTIHRLLSYNPKSNAFNNTKDNQFDKKSIFIIDETSMIDIVLFKNLLEAIPDEARVFLLGDKDQLPSVQAGAVLGDLLGQIKDKIELEKSHRFTDDSFIGSLKKEIQKDSPFPENMGKFGTTISDFEKLEFADWKKDEYPVTFYDLYSESSKEMPLSKLANKVCVKWANKFCLDLVEASSGLKKDCDLKKLDEFWEKSLSAKILCAENKGKLGIHNLNDTISKYIIKRCGLSVDESGYFAGQLLIVTQNQKLFNLYNGDCGIVVTFGDSNIKYLMVEKKQVSDDKASDVNQEIFRRGNYLFYPLYLLPADSIDTAYAITIHKSQGSGYRHIMVILPEQIGHPLLNRQIFYTAVTRTEGNTYIVATKAAMDYAKRTLITRDTKIKVF